MDTDEPEVGYKWEGSYTEGLNINEALAEDDSGSVEKAIAKLIEEAKRRRREQERPTKKRIGALRYMYLVVDNSVAMTDKSLEPDRLRCTQKALKNFVHSYFRENPLSQLGLITVKDKVSEIVTPLTSSVKELEEGLDTLNVFECKGDFSLQNGVLRAYHNLQGLPMHAHREVVVIMSAMTSIDFSDVFTTMENFKRNQITVHGIHLACELYVLRKFCSKTRGLHGVVLNDVHFDVVLGDIVVPPKGHLFAKQTHVETFYKMGFPKKERITDVLFCACHKDSFKDMPDTNEHCRIDEIISPFGFLCVQCRTRVCSLPMDCPTCGLRLVSATQIAKAQMHIVPLPVYAELNAPDNTVCFSCNYKFPRDSKMFKCKFCNEVFCDECDVANHQSMICPGCSQSHVHSIAANGNGHANGIAY
uniref:General transcription factor IIH subunit n=1 Tax=Panagrellus redivivus TaxID=6233 RepID=A0A7E4V1Q0_PANRE